MRESVCVSLDVRVQYCVLRTSAVPYPYPAYFGPGPRAGRTWRAARALIDSTNLCQTTRRFDEFQTDSAEVQVSCIRAVLCGGLPASPHFSWHWHWHWHSHSRPGSAGTGTVTDTSIQVW